jgi:iron complex transport system ATP-binding protein
MSLFRVEHAEYRYPDGTRAVEAMDLAVEQGRFYGIVGPNGSGKSTLLDLLLGYKQPVSGRVLFRDRPLSAWRRRDLAREIALVPQEFALTFPFSVEEIVFMGRYPHIPRFGAPGPEDRKVVRRIMEQTGIAPYRDRYITELSGGEKQRAVVARALAQETRVLLLDEATSNLDIKHGLQLLHLVRQRQVRHGATVVSVFHDLNQALRFCDELIFLKRGRLIRCGPVSEVATEEILEYVFEVRAKSSLEPSLGRPQAVFWTEEPEMAGEEA